MSCVWLNNMCEIFRICLDNSSKAWKFPVMLPHDGPQIAPKKSGTQNSRQKRMYSANISTLAEKSILVLYIYTSTCIHMDEDMDKVFDFIFRMNHVAIAIVLIFWHRYKSLNHFCCTQSAITTVSTFEY